jgi:dihydrolipoamide dehydrogenase
MNEHDLIVIGAGPGGYVAALRAAQLGMNVACVEKEQRLGGTCLRIGCIPSKALLESSEKFAEAKEALAGHGVVTGDVSLDLEAMLRRKDAVVDKLTSGIAGLFKKNGVTWYRGDARLTGPGEVHVQGEEPADLSAPQVIIATGSVPAKLPGVEEDGDRIAGSERALSYPEVPGRLIVIGAGYIGLELGSVWRRLGSEVTVLEYLDRILPGMDAEIAAEAHKLFKKQGLSFELGAKVTGARLEGDECVVEVEGKEPYRADRVLLAVGRKPYAAGLGLEELGVETDERGRIKVDDAFQTNVPGVFAIGDVIRGPMLAHKAEEEGVACVERMGRGYGHVNYEAIPAVCYTEPEIASVGQTEEDLNNLDIPYVKGAFPFMANGRARALGRTEGRVKVLAHADSDRILGAHIIGPRAGDLIAEAATAIEFGASSEDLARTCHAHPTLAECLKEAALGALGRTLHA